MCEREVILKDSIRINAPPEKVWHYLENPGLLKRWNPKIKEIVPISWGQPARGHRYRITYVMGGKEREFSAEIEEYQSPVNLVIRLTGGSLPPTGYAQELYELSREHGETLLTQTIRVHNSGINVLVRLLMAVLQRFGKPTGKKYLVLLKELVEGNA